MPRPELEIKQAVFNPDMLAEVLENFNLSSRRLEDKYQKLLSETEVLKEQLRQKDEEIKRAERLSMLGETAAGIAHEIRNPLGAIKLFASVLKRDVKDQPQAYKLTEQIEKSVFRLNSVVSNILSFAKDEKPGFAPVNLNSIIEEQILQFAAEDQGGIEFITKLEGSPFIIGNEHGLRQVIHNIIFNAVQSTKNQGKITIHSWNEENFLYLSVRDNGPGVPKDIIEKIFEPFVTSKNEGTGLGLSIVRKILDQHEADIEVFNDCGAVFRIGFKLTRVKKG